MAVPRPIPGWRPSTPEVRGLRVEDLVQQHPAVAIHFWAPWNGYDPLMDRSIQSISGKFAGRVVFVSCNVDLGENGELCQRCGFKNIPALGLLVSGHQPISEIGYRDPEKLAGVIESWLKEPERKRKPSWVFWS
jgi:thioredoxin-like negative regulator of GroEL